MKNKLAFKSLTILFSTLTLCSAWAQEHSGNGGISVVCRDQAGKITSARLLDLWEAENDPTLHLSVNHHSTLTVDQEINRSIKKIKIQSPTLAYDTRYFLKIVRKSLLPLRNSSQVGISLPSDFTPRLAPKGNCHFEAAAKYLANGDIQLDPEIVGHFDAKDEAALYVHEAIYMAARENTGIQNSDSTRLVVGNAFATHPGTMAFATILENNDHPTLSMNEQVIVRGEGGFTYTVPAEQRPQDAAYLIDTTDVIGMPGFHTSFYGNLNATRYTHPCDGTSVVTVTKAYGLVNNLFVLIKFENYIPNSLGTKNTTTFLKAIDFNQIPNGVPFRFRIIYR